MTSYTRMPDDKKLDAIPSFHRQKSAMASHIEEIQQGNKDATPSMSELMWPKNKEETPGNILAGLISGLKVVLGMVVFANIVFNTSDNESIRALFPTGINLNLMAASVALVWSTLFSGMNALVAPQDVPAIVLGQMSIDIAHAVENKENAGHTLLAAGWISTIMTGSIVLFLGWMKAGDMLRRLPSPVIGGFIASTGATGIRSALGTLTGAKFYIVWPTSLEPFHDWKTWAILGLALYSLISMRYLAGWIKPYIHNKDVKALLSPLCLLSPIFVFYLVLGLKGNFSGDLAWVRSVGWMYEKSASEPFYAVWEKTLDFERVEWHTLADPSVLSSLFVLASLTALSATLSIVGTVPVVPCASNLGGVGGKVDLDKELVVLGSGQFVAGVLTGLPGYTQTALSANMYIFGGTYRLGEAVATCFVFLTLTSGVQIAPLIPKFFLGAVFLNLGLSFCKTHLVDNFGVMGKAEYCSMLAIVFMALWQDLTKAVGLGIGIQILLVVKQASKVNAVYQAGSTGGGFISARIRHMDHASRLRWNMKGLELESVLGKIEVVRLQGPVFFGNAPNLQDDLRSLIRVSKTMTHLLLDMNRVTQVDDSGARALAKVLEKARDKGTVERFAISGSGKLRIQFEKHLSGVSGDTPVVEWFDSMDDALESYEDDILSPWAESAGAAFPKPHGLTDAEWETVKNASSSQRQLKDGEQLIDFGAQVDGVWVLAEGSVSLETMRAGVGSSAAFVTSKLAAPNVIGISALFTGARLHAFRVKARGGATLLVLTKADLEKLESNDPRTYIAFLKKFAGYWGVVEGNHLRWRSALSSF